MTNPWKQSRADLRAELGDLLGMLSGWGHTAYQLGLERRTNDEPIVDEKDPMLTAEGVRLRDAMRSRAQEILAELFPAAPETTLGERDGAHEAPPSRNAPYGGDIDGWIAKIAQRIVDFGPRPEMRAHLEDSHMLAYELAHALLKKNVRRIGPAELMQATQRMQKTARMQELARDILELGNRHDLMTGQPHVLHKVLEQSLKLAELVVGGGPRASSPGAGQTETDTPAAQHSAFAPFGARAVELARQIRGLFENAVVNDDDQAELERLAGALATVVLREEK